MKDFIFQAYNRYLLAIKKNFSNILRFDEYFLVVPKPDNFCLIRHDVDRRPQKALEMSKVERDLGIKATYYFRYKSNTFNSKIIKEIENDGHEIGYHYESLSDKRGNVPLALQDFTHNLNEFRKIATIRTISMHGNPFSPFDNRELWRDPENHDLLFKKLGILGEIYLDIDYNDIAYIGDTGRNWFSSRSNIRDQVETHIKTEFENGEALLQYLSSNPHLKLVFQIHPERWTDQRVDYYLIFLSDMLVNMAKYIIKSAKRRNSNGNT